MAKSRSLEFSEPVEPVPKKKVGGALASYFDTPSDAGSASESLKNARLDRERELE